MKLKFCEKYFENKVKPKHLQEFIQKTPQCNEISGYICRKANKYLGSLVITHIKEKNGESYDVEQFIQSFPKIHYWDGRHKLKEDTEHVDYHCQEKLDGTCLIIYPLKNNKNELLEIIPKSRSKAVADDHILEMYNLVDNKNIIEFFSKEENINNILMFELYGILNKHEIAHMDTYIDIKLIGAYINGSFLDYDGIKLSSNLSKFSLPNSIFRIIKYPNESEFIVQWYGFESRIKNYEINCEYKFPTLYDAISEVKVLLEKINSKYIEFNNRRAIEGVVINGQHFYNGQMYLKIKPKDIENEAKRRDSVPRRFILKETRKYFDEYGSQVKSLYEEDETHYIEYVKRQLKEEFSYEQIEDPRTRKRIRSIFMDVWDSKLPSVSIQNICEDLIKQYPDKNTSELMKIFAREYPSKKKQSRFVYTILSKIQKRV